MLSVIELSSNYAAELAALDKIYNPPGWSEKLFLAEFGNNNSHILGVLAADKIIAYLVFRIVHTEAEILSVAVVGDQRRKGFAAKLMQKTLDRLKAASVSEVYLEVRAGNLAAQELYKKFGFRQVGLRKNYYQDNQEDALLMRLSA